MLTASMALFSKYPRACAIHTAARYALHASRSNNIPISRRNQVSLHTTHHTSTPASQHRWKLLHPKIIPFHCANLPRGEAASPPTRRAARTTPYIALPFPLPTYPPSVYHVPRTKPLPEGPDKIARTRIINRYIKCP